MNGNMADLSSKQKTILSEFRKNLDDVLTLEHDDRYLLRFLRARCWDKPKAEKMFRENIIWRQQVGADSIVETFQVPEVIQKYYPGGLHGRGKSGHPIYIENFGYIDTKGMLYSAKKSDIIKNKIVDCEKILITIEEHRQKYGGHIGGYLLVYDMEKFGMKHVWKPVVDFYTEVVAILEAHYPEIIFKIYIINAPRIFPLLYSLVKGFLTEDTKNKIFMLGSNWREILLKEIDADQLPVHYGGTATDVNGDPMCRAQIGFGGTIPKEYYLTAESLMDIDACTKGHVGKGSSLQIDYTIDIPGSVIRYQFFTHGHDIGFGIFRRSDGFDHKRQSATDMTTLVQSMRVNCHMVPEDGTFICEQTGTYVLRFDNTYSWVTAKTVYYQIEVLSPADLDDINCNNDASELK